MGDVVLPGAAGEATITGKTVNGLTATCRVTVKPAPAPTGVVFYQTTVESKDWKPFENIPQVTPGYANCDGVIDIADPTCISRHIVGAEKIDFDKSYAVLPQNPKSACWVKA